MLLGPAEQDPGARRCPPVTLLRPVPAALELAPRRQTMLRWMFATRRRVRLWLGGYSMQPQLTLILGGLHDNSEASTLEPAATAARLRLMTLDGRRVG